jgi:pimeloyl-ACP methyl ester carboxylesterase
LTSDAINRKLMAAGSNDTLARLFWHRQRPYSMVEASLPKTSENAIALAIQAVAGIDFGEILEEIDVPVLTVYGDKDSVISPPREDELEDSHYTARAIVLSDAHHFPMLDQAAMFGRLVRDFMDLDGVEGLPDLAIKQEWRRRTR